MDSEQGMKVTSGHTYFCRIAEQLWTSRRAVLSRPLVHHPAGHSLFASRVMWFYKAPEPIGADINKLQSRLSKISEEISQNGAAKTL